MGIYQKTETEIIKLQTDLYLVFSHQDIVQNTVLTHSSHNNGLPKEYVISNFFRKCHHYLHLNPSINVTSDNNVNI
jgi:hypothetical protein